MGVPTERQRRASGPSLNSKLGIAIVGSSFPANIGAVLLRAPARPQVVRGTLTTCL